MAHVPVMIKREFCNAEKTHPSDGVLMRNFLIYALLYLIELSPTNTFHVLLLFASRLLVEVG